MKNVHPLTRELRVVDGVNRVDIINVIDKKNVYEQKRSIWASVSTFRKV